MNQKARRLRKYRSRNIEAITLRANSFQATSFNCTQYFFRLTLGIPSRGYGRHYSAEGPAKRVKMTRKAKFPWFSVIPRTTTTRILFAMRPLGRFESQVFYNPVKCYDAHTRTCNKLSPPPLPLRLQFSRC